MADRHAGGSIGVGLTLLLILAGCKQAAFARHEGDLMHEPPPVLTDSNGFWNDPATGSFGEVSFAAGLYRRQAGICRPARQTIVDTVARTTADATLLYCRSSDGTWQWQRSVICRANANDAGLICRDGDGADFVMAPA